MPIATVWIAAVQILAVQWAARSVYRISGRPEPAAVQRAVGQLIRVLLPIQAAIVATAAIAAQSLGGWVTALVLLAAWPVAAVGWGRVFDPLRRPPATRRFYAS